MKKVSERNMRIFATICFLIAGMLNMFQKKYMLGSLFIILTIIYSKSYLRKEKIGVIIILACVIAIV
ncbi:hypothetical protein LI056_15120 [Clostridium perfringens]|uniref:hypothetical protein n=1 Tax=Clostridium perfringens TaxID=1502 RepID=UPI00224587FF|nr:hypothetical protein [Clostridium perfringens]MCX0359309.1 hypothetical protein [Clostridium perfringens]MCX0408704.1 hypothetical protein [Clostridium perfringens]MCX0418393.1 hypothetical protein [Clostridium perfringens]